MAKSKTKSSASDERIKKAAADLASLAASQREETLKEKSIKKTIAKKKDKQIHIKRDIFNLLKKNNRIATISGKAMKVIEDLTLDLIEYILFESSDLAKLQNRQMVNVRDIQAALNLTFLDKEIATFARNEGARAVIKFNGRE